jgi:Ca-activated chloride channel family protein
MEARKVFVHELGATLVTIAKDVKVQVEFNPAQVAEYRLVGYENRLLAAEDFNDDAKDGGELGAGHSVTAIYEIVPVGRTGSGSVDELRYQSRDVTRGGTRTDELLTVKLRYQPPSGGASRLVSRVVRTGERGAPETLGFAAAVAEFGMLLRNSEHKGTSSWDDVLRLAKGGMGRDPGGYRAEFVRLVEVARGMSSPGSDIGLRE